MSTPTAPEERLTYTVPEVARLLGIARSTAYRAVESGDLPAVRVRGRLLVPRASLKQMFDQKRRQALVEGGHIDPDVAAALDERVEWIQHAFDVGREQGVAALGPLINEIPDEHLRSVIFVLLLQRDSDYKNVRQMLASLN